jgi:hypothetical protein
MALGAWLAGPLPYWRPTKRVCVGFRVLVVMPVGWRNSSRFMRRLPACRGDTGECVAIRLTVRGLIADHADIEEQPTGSLHGKPIAGRAWFGVNRERPVKRRQGG